jgi:hypothetical protein
MLVLEHTAATEQQCNAETACRDCLRTAPVAANHHHQTNNAHASNTAQPNTFH